MEFNSLTIRNASVTKQLLSDYNGTRTHNHLVRKGTLDHLVKLVNY